MQDSVVLEKQPGPVTPDDPNEILTVRQAAEVLKVSYSHMLRLIRGEVTGMPPVHHVRAGRSVRIRRGALTEWIRKIEHSSVHVQAAWSGSHAEC
jgi:excisionase family DNA binding protein